MTNLVRFAPNRELRRLQNEFDRLFNGFFPSEYEQEEGRAVWSPRVDLAESEDAYTILVDAPGMDKDGFQINYENGTLSISGERKLKERDETKNFMRMERSYGHFFRSFTLPESIDGDKIEARYENGELMIHVPKTEESKPRRIEIQ